MFIIYIFWIKCSLKSNRIFKNGVWDTADTASPLYWTPLMPYPWYPRHRWSRTVLYVSALTLYQTPLIRHHHCLRNRYDISYVWETADAVLAVSRTQRIFFSWYISAKLKPNSVDIRPLRSVCGRLRSMYYLRNQRLKISCYCITNNNANCWKLFCLFFSRFHFTFCTFHFFYLSIFFLLLS
jgi:hypothetical protein